MKLLALIMDTFREIYAKKVIVGIIVLEVITLVITGLILFSEDIQEDYAKVAAGNTQVRGPVPAEVQDENFSADDSVLEEMDTPGTVDSLDSTSAPLQKSRTFDNLPGAPISTIDDSGLREKVKGQLSIFAGLFSGAVLFLGIFMTAGLVPSMMEKGTIDLLLSKPLPRWLLLFGRALGGVTAVAINVVMFTLAVYALYGYASGIWYFPFVIWTVILSLLGFVTIYSAILLLNVLTESWVLPMSLAYIHTMILSLFLTNRESMLYPSISSPAIRTVIEGLYYALPPSQGVSAALTMQIFSSTLIPDEVLLHCAAFTVVMLALAAWRFGRKDF